MTPLLEVPSSTEESALDWAQRLDAGNSERALLAALESLGRLPDGFDGRLLVLLLKHASPDVRLLAVKNIGKLKDETFFEDVRRFALAESNTLARREAVSAIGRMKLQRAVPTLLNFLHDRDAKIVLQAIRALTPFKAVAKVGQALQELQNHPNELIQAAVGKEVGAKTRAKNDATHAQSPDFMKNLLVYGDVRDILPQVPDESVHLTFTSPPYYNARDYTIYQSYEEYLQMLVGIFKEVHRITKEGRFFVLNTSPVLIPRMSRSHSSTRYER